MFKFQCQPFTLALLGSVFLLLSACQSGSGCTQGQSSCFKVAAKAKVSDATLNSQFQYVKLSLNGNVVWIAQGAVDQWPVANTAVYYGADRSVVKFANGRLKSLITQELSWKETQAPQVNWSYFKQDNAKAMQFQRQIDTIDGVSALQEQRQLQRIAAPKHHAYSGDSQALVWVQETTLQSNAAKKRVAYFDTWYALHPDHAEPVYAQQCLSAKHCITWQQWRKTP
ncbi:MAG: hypothetical protein Q4D05_05200 [Acinetobacter sp.]|nr:hypothetical protein [Acinetobacter sp.]